MIDGGGQRQVDSRTPKGSPLSLERMVRPRCHGEESSATDQRYKSYIQMTGMTRRSSTSNQCCHRPVRITTTMAIMMSAATAKLRVCQELGGLQSRGGTYVIRERSQNSMRVEAMNAARISLSFLFMARQAA